MNLPPRLAWFSLLAAVVLVPLAVGAVPFAGTPLTLNVFVQAKLIVMSLTLAVALGAWALHDLRHGALYLGRPLIPLAAVLGVAVLSTAFALDPRLAFFGDFEQGVGLLVYLLAGLACFLTAQLVRDVKALGSLTGVVVATGAAVAAIGLSQQVFGIDLVGIGHNLSEEWILQRGYGTIGNADSYAAYLVLPAILGLHRLRQVTSAKDFWVWGAATAAMLTSLVMTQTRGPLLGFTVAAVAYIVISRRREARAGFSKSKKTAGTSPVSPRLVMALVIAALVAGIGGAMVFGTGSDFAARLSPASIASLGGRTPLWASAVEVASERPLLGTGPDSFRLGWYGVRTVDHLSAGTGLVITDPHSVPLFLAATTGVLGLVAAALLLGASLFVGFRMNRASNAGRGASDYTAWLYGLVGLSIVLLAGMLTSALTLMLFVCLGVVLAPTLRKVSVDTRWRGGLSALAALAAVALLGFAGLSAVAQTTAVTARTGDAALASARADRAAELAPWDTEIRNLRHETLVNSAFESVFTQQPDAASRVREVQAELERAEEAAPHEYLLPYRLALLLIGSGPQLGADFTGAGIEAGLRGLEIYPNSLELRTGLASGYLSLDEPQKAEDMLKEHWSADPAYLSAGITFAEVLLAQDKVEAASDVVSVLEQRFADKQPVRELRTRVSTESER